MSKYGKKSGFFLICAFLVLFGLEIPAPIQAAPDKKVIPVFCYHRITPKIASPYDLTPEQLEAHFQFFKDNGYHPITASQLLEYRRKPVLFPEKPVVLTFDDGTKSHYTRVLPLLKKYGFKATFFIFPNATRGSKKRWLSWDELTEIVGAGMDIGSHALSHPYLTFRDRMDDQQYYAWLEKELVQSKQTLEEKLHIHVNTLAYPFGLYNREVEAAAIKAGYAGMFSINMGLNRIRDNPYRLKRRLVVNSMGPKSLANLLGERVLDLEIQSPADTDMLASLSVIRFRIKTPAMDRVRLEVSKYQAVVKPDGEGVYSYTIPGKLKPGFYSIIVRGKDADNRSYLNSWAFFINSPRENGTVGERSGAKRKA
jgi:peptidoglycan/xylan/chitin deacetylase (PgdA/CDA1 family)